MRLLAWLTGVPLAVVLAVFAVANRQEMRIDLWPLPWAVDVAVYLAVLLPLVAGAVIGGLAVWAAGHGARRAARTERKRAQSLDRQLAALQARQDEQHTALPALPPPTSAA